MTEVPNKTTANRRLTVAQWASAVTQFELGMAHCSTLATDFGISRQAMSKGLQKRGAKKASRVSETVAMLHREFDERDRRSLAKARDFCDTFGAWLATLLATMGEQI